MRGSTVYNYAMTLWLLGSVRAVYMVLGGSCGAMLGGAHVWCLH